MKKIKNRHSESHARSVVKAITYRVIITISIFSITLWQTGELADAAAITGLTAIVSTIIYYFHERVWSRVAWGRIK